MSTDGEVVAAEDIALLGEKTAHVNTSTLQAAWDWRGGGRRSMAAC